MRDQRPPSRDFGIGRAASRRHCLLGNTFGDAAGDTQVLRLAAGEHRIDRDLLHRGRPQVRRDDGDSLVRGSRRTGQHPQHQNLGGRHHRQSVAPAAVEHRLVFVLGVGQLHPPRAQPAAAVSDRELVSRARIQRPGAAARPVGRQVSPEPRESRSAPPLLAQPAFAAVHFDAVFDPQQGRDGDEVEAVGHRQPAVIDHPGRLPSGRPGRPGGRPLTGYAARARRAPAPPAGRWGSLA
jgi:hypothetical protein